MPVDPLHKFVSDHQGQFDTENVPSSIWTRIAAQLPLRENDSLESFVREMREDFDTEDPPAKMVEHIFRANQLPSTGTKVRAIGLRKRSMRWMRAAAAAVVLLLAGSLYLGRQMGFRAAQQQQLAMIQAVAPDFFETEDYYQTQIDQTFRQVKQVNSDPTLRTDLSAIDESMKEIREELTNVPPEERAELIAELIESYQLKLRILERVLQALPQNPDSNYLQNERQNELQEL